MEKLPYSKNALEEFLFEKKSGNCEFFASATALILRINNIPARVVAGYKGADYNNIANYYVVFNKNAHTWVEYYYNGYWNLLDTTPAVRYSILQKKGHSFLFKIRLLFDTINYYYINFVIDFNFQKQVKMFKSFSNLLKNLENTAHLSVKAIMYVIFYMVLLLLVLIICIQIFRYFSTPFEKRILKEFYKRMEKYGYVKAENEGLTEFIESIKDKNLKLKAKEFASIFENFYYKDRKFPKSTKEKLKHILKRI
ncbi:transglutaminase-like enzyme, putative cysteine protease [Hydrogenivirga sp. 128-5-R1-1]|nr:transglutaminase-like enzyme, putative cysteine protease [Hydrogenivirga sp. 128-5-R1-1]